MRRSDLPVTFASRVIAWTKTSGRKGLPWSATRDPYRLWVSEIMLQQTRVATATPYYRRFLRKFPNVRALAEADADSVLAQWSGLGYYRRARYMHSAAKMVVEKYQANFPSDAATLSTLPGVGRSTAAAVAAFSTGERCAILDGNVKRVLARHRGVVGDTSSAAIEGELWRIAQSAMPLRDVAIYTQGMMDLGATLCLRSKPRCTACPVEADCIALREGRTASLPTPRTRRRPQHREVQLLIIERGREVLLERRPSSGVWPELWSVPEAATNDDPIAVIRDRIGLIATSSATLDPVRHQFTHFTLTLRPTKLRTNRTTGKLPSAWRWLEKRALMQVAMPAPIRRLILAE